MKLYHVIDNLILDLMHDLFEGVARDVIEKILMSLIYLLKKINLETVNNRIDTFQYSEFKENNKPSPLSIETTSTDDEKITGLKNKVKCKQSATQMACHVRYLSLIMGDLVPSGFKPRRLYNLLRKVVVTVTARNYVEADLHLLSEYIDTFLRLYIQLYGPLKPKAF